MEKYTMFMDRKNQYSENEYTTQSNLQIGDGLEPPPVQCHEPPSIVHQALNLSDLVP